MKSFAIYIHYPYCVSKCRYCSFASRACAGAAPDLSQKYIKELGFYQKSNPSGCSRRAGRYFDSCGVAGNGRGSFACFEGIEKPDSGAVTSVYFGGGTPSLMRPESVGKVLDGIELMFGLAAGAEVSLEANPKTVDSKKLRAFRAAGINRLSIGAQSLDDDRLGFLGRAHTAAEALHTIDEAGKVFENLSADFIYAVPGQGLDEWASELERIAALGLPHLSLYQLSIERGTPMYGTAKPIGEAPGAKMFEYTNRRLRRPCPQYEVSNYARRGFECRHNINYWTGGRYIGIGPGAAGRVRIGDRFFETKNPDTAEKWTGRPDMRPLGRKARARELLLGGLRMNRGIRFSEFEENCGLDFWAAANREKAEDLARAGMLSISGKKIRVRAKGAPILDRIILEISE